VEEKKKKMGNAERSTGWSQNTLYENQVIMSERKMEVGNNYVE